MSADDVVDLQITLESTAPTRAGFGTPLILTHKAPVSWGADLVRSYASADDMLADGFVSSDHEYKMAVAIKSQQPSPPLFKVGRMQVGGTPIAPIQVIRLTPVAQANAVYSGKIAGLPFTFTADGTPTVAEICTGLAAAITALAGVTAADDTTHVTSTTDAAGVVLQYTELTPNLTVKDMSVDPGDIAAAIAELRAFDDDWYLIHNHWSAEVIANEFAAAIEPGPKRKLLVMTSADGDLKTSSSTDLGSDLMGLNYFRTALFYHQDVGSMHGLALAAQRLTDTPGSDTWAHKELVGVVVTKLTTAEAGFLKGKNVNYYVSLAGNGDTLWGKVAGGDYADLVRGIDHLYARIQEDIITLLQTLKKVPFTNKGIAMVVGTVQNQLDAHAQEPINLLTAEPPNAPVCTGPDISQVDIADKALRRLTGVKFTGKCQGAIHLVQIRGTVSI